MRERVRLKLNECKWEKLRVRERERGNKSKREGELVGVREKKIERKTER